MTYVRTAKWKRMNPSSPWNDVKLCARLESLYSRSGADYKSAEEIANILNTEFKTAFTRSAIIGRAGQQGLKEKYPRSTAKPGPKRGATSRRASPAPRERATDSSAGAFMRKVQRDGLAPPMPKVAVVTPSVDEPPRAGTPLMEAEDHNCRWPFPDNEGRSMCCGRLKEKRASYCVEHGNIGRQAIRPPSSVPTNSYGRRVMGGLNKFR